ncbi:hypothetical protein [Amycolatopsis sp. FDAARGOS 1241]|uniref:hypothetical protein n=1 Tax=Amycolatopsis sp. FDAARGOS 1241 TaxID=2778070 RepID=UPI0019513B46|nr:hypothetical protein [Amycolatopsis sp. FDAARGOS 1241]QRP49065.1 hypothetical protein I6J71_15465 [Amycolatopsis sp. FDAARGOS 1241]
MTIADQLHQLRAELVVTDSSGYRPVGGLAAKFEKPHSLADQLGHNIVDEPEEGADQ